MPAPKRMRGVGTQRVGGGFCAWGRRCIPLGRPFSRPRFSSFFFPPHALFIPVPSTLVGIGCLCAGSEAGCVPILPQCQPFPAVYTPRAPQGHRELVSVDKLRMLKLVTVLCVAHAAALMPAARPLKLSSKHARAMPLQMSDVKGPKDWAFIKGKVRRTSTPCLDRPAAGVVVAVRLRLRLSCLCRRPRAAPPPFGIAPSLSPRGCASS